MASDRVIHDLRLVPIEGRPTVIYRRRAASSTLDERVRAQVVAYRTFVADGDIYTDVLVEDMAGVQEFMALQKVTFMKKAAEIPAPQSVRPASTPDFKGDPGGTYPPSGF